MGTYSTVLRNHSLYNVLQRMVFGFLEVVASVDRVEPSIQEELCPLSVTDYKTTRCQSVFVLRDDKVYPVALQVAECLDDAFWRNDGGIGEHVGLKLGGRKDRGVKGNVHVHYQGGMVKIPHKHRGGIECHGMAHCRHARPGGWRVADRVLIVGWEEG